MVSMAAVSKSLVAVQVAVALWLHEHLDFGYLYAKRRGRRSEGLSENVQNSGSSQSPFIIGGHEQGFGFLTFSTT